MIKKFSNSDELAKYLANEILEHLQKKNKCVLGCPGGRSLTKTYYQLGRISHKKKISLKNRSSIADFMIICSGTSNRHVISLSNFLEEALKKENLNTLNVEGIRNGDWVLVDAGDIIIHLFRSEVREYYGLEKMWAEEEINSYIK